MRPITPIPSHRYDLKKYSNHSRPRPPCTERSRVPPGSIPVAVYVPTIYARTSASRMRGPESVGLTQIDCEHGCVVNFIHGTTCTECAGCGSPVDRSLPPFVSMFRSEQHNLSLFGYTGGDSTTLGRKVFARSIGRHRDYMCTCSLLATTRRGKRARPRPTKGVISSILILMQIACYEVIHEVIRSARSSGQQ